MKCDPCEQTVEGWDFYVVMVKCYDGEIRSYNLCERCYMEDINGKSQ